MKRTRWPWLLTAALIVLAGAGICPAGHELKDDEKILEQANLKTDGPALLNFLKQRTLNDTEMIQVEALIQQLGAEAFAKRELAKFKLIERGPVVVPLLLKYFNHKDLEISDRAKECVEKIQEKDVTGVLELSAVLRVIADRKPEGTADVVLQYLPFVTKDEVAREARKTLTVVAMKAGQADSALVKGLTDKNPIIRSAAGEALALVKDKAHEQQVLKLLDDPATLVRFHVALGLTLAEQPKGMTALIQLVPDLDWPEACQVEDLLYQVAAGDADRPKVSLGTTKKALTDFSKGWEKWWNAHQAKINLAVLKDGPRVQGYTVIVLLEAGRILELGHKNEIRWEINDLKFPLDVQILPNERVLVAEYQGARVTERDLKGKIKWEQAVPGLGPLAAQRLKNGNTFIATDNLLMEVDKDHNKIFTQGMPVNERVMKAIKLEDGRIVCLTKGDSLQTAQLRVLNAQGKEMKKFDVDKMTKQLFGGRLYMTPKGNVLVPNNGENIVIEYSLDGAKPWQVKVAQPVAAVRLFNGNTLITTMDLPGKVIQYDDAGNEVWSYETSVQNTKITRALRR